MRLAGLGLALALTGSAPLVASAQAPVTTHPLAQGEVLLEVNAMGLVTSRADRATLTVNMPGSGRTEAEARADAARNVGETRALLRAQGIADTDIREVPLTATTLDPATQDAMTNAMATMDEAVVDHNSADAMTEPSATVNAPVEIVVRNVNNVGAIQSALMRRGIFSLQNVNYALDDHVAPRRQARAQAMQRARVDADSYAAALNLRVVRVVRVTERLGFDLLGMAASEAQAIMNLFGPSMMRSRGGPEVETMVLVGVDFALAPR